MPVNVTDVNEFTDPIVGPADSDPADRTYVMTIAQGAGNRTRYLKNRLDALEVTGGFTFKDGRTAGIIYLGANAAMIDVAADWLRTASVILSQANAAQATFDLTGILQRGQSAEIDWVRVLVEKGAARSPGSRVTTKLLGQTYGVSFGSPSRTNTTHSTVEDAGGTGYEWILHDHTSAPLSVGLGQTWQLEVTAGVDGGSHVSDTICAVAVQVSALGLSLI